MQIDEKRLRVYLLREVANKNRRIMSIMHSGESSARNQYSGGFNEIITTFAGGYYSQVLDTIFEDIASNPKKGYSAYYYFDIDTLISYLAFLSNVIAGADQKAYTNGRRFPNVNDFNDGLKSAQKQLIDYAMTEETGFYDKRNPITIAYGTRRDGSYGMIPTKPLSEKEFIKKYDKVECQKELEAYIAMKHPRKNPTNSVNDSSPKDEIEEVEADLGYKDYKYNGRIVRLKINKIAYYIGENNEQLISLEASGQEGTLYGVYTYEGYVYNGNMYDNEGNMVEINGGGETFFPNKMSAVDVAKCKSSQKKGKPKKYDPNEDDNQIKLF